MRVYDEKGYPELAACCGKPFENLRYYIYEGPGLRLPPESQPKK
jgi:hypothetical protein